MVHTSPMRNVNHGMPERELAVMWDQPPQSEHFAGRSRLDQRLAMLLMPG